MQNLTTSSLDKIHHSAIDTAVNLAQQFGRDSLNDETPDDIKALIDAHTHPLTDDGLAEMTNPPSEDEGQGEKEDTQNEKDGPTLGRQATVVRMASEPEASGTRMGPFDVSFITVFKYN